MSLSVCTNLLNIITETYKEKKKKKRGACMIALVFKTNARKHLRIN